MSEIRDKIIELYWHSSSPVYKNLIDNIGIFSDNEINQLYMIINQTDTEKLKQVLIYQDNIIKSSIDKLTSLAKEVHQIEQEYKNNKKEEEANEAEKFLETNLQLIY